MVNKDCDGPCRETAKTRLERLIEGKQSDINGLKSLLKFVENVEEGSDVEYTIWRLLCGNTFFAPW
jgi:hypothetical protein